MQKLIFMLICVVFLPFSCSDSSMNGVLRNQQGGGGYDSNLKEEDNRRRSDSRRERDQDRNSDRRDNSDRGDHNSNRLQSAALADGRTNIPEYCKDLPVLEMKQACIDGTLGVTVSCDRWLAHGRQCMSAKVKVMEHVTIPRINDRMAGLLSSAQLRSQMHIVQCEDHSKSAERNQCFRSHCRNPVLRCDDEPARRNCVRTNRYHPIQDTFMERARCMPHSGFVSCMEQANRGGPCDPANYYRGF